MGVPSIFAHMAAVVVACMAYALWRHGPDEAVVQVPIASPKPRRDQRECPWCGSSVPVGSVDCAGCGGSTPWRR